MIELRHLRYFIAVAEELNFRRAAERVHVDQTPLSRTVRDLEEQLGVALLVRSSRRLDLTPAGAALLQHARGLFVRLERIKRAVRETDARHRAPLRIGVADGIAQTKLSKCFVSWRALVPEIPLEITEMSADELGFALRREEVDVGFSFGIPDDEAITQELAWGCPLVALLPCDHELAGRKVLSISELLAFPMVACRPDRLPGLRRQMDVVRQSCAIKPVISAEARTLVGYVIRVAAGMGVGVADADHMATLRRSDVVVVPLAEDIQVKTYVLHKRQLHGLPVVLRRFLAHAKTEARP